MPTTQRTMAIRPKVMAKRLKEAERLAKKNGGKLPNPWTMIQQGHGGLYRYIQRHPKEFEHLPVEEAVGTDNHKVEGRTSFNVAIRLEHLTLARKLADQNGGEVPDTNWLTAKGYTRLASYMKTYPHVFLNLNVITAKRSKRRR